MKNYDGKHYCSYQEFANDLRRIKYIKKLITRYLSTGDLKERLILNHIIVLNNVFGPVATSRILYFKMAKQFDCIKPFLVLLQILPEKLFNINGKKVIDTDCIKMDTNIVEALRKI